MGPNRVDVSLPPPEKENKSSFRNVVISSYLEFRAMGKVQKHSVSECNTLSSEAFRFYLKQNK
jgi:hypothetical protein